MVRPSIVSVVSACSWRAEGQGVVAAKNDVLLRLRPRRESPMMRARLSRRPTKAATQAKPTDEPSRAPGDNPNGSGPGESRRILRRGSPAYEGRPQSRRATLLPAGARDALAELGIAHLHLLTGNFAAGRTGREARWEDCALPDLGAVVLHAGLPLAPSIATIAPGIRTCACFDKARRGSGRK